MAREWLLELDVGDGVVRGGGRGFYCLLGVKIGPESDAFVWALEDSGRFSLASASASAIARVSTSSCPTPSHFWPSCILKKWATLIWRAFLHKLPSDDVLTSLGYSLASGCHCCIARRLSLGNTADDLAGSVSSWGSSSHGRQVVATAIICVT